MNLERSIDHHDTLRVTLDSWGDRQSDGVLKTIQKIECLTLDILSNAGHEPEAQEKAIHGAIAATDRLQELLMTSTDSEISKRITSIIIAIDKASYQTIQECNATLDAITKIL